MPEIIPAIMPKNLTELENSVALVCGAVDYVQVDVMDGRFVPERDWPFPDFDAQTAPFIVNEETGLPFWDSVNYEFDLMIRQPEKFAEKFIQIGAGRIIIHYESAEKEAIWEAVRKVKVLNTEVGIAIDTVTPNEVLDEFLSGNDKIDFVQFMGIARIGYQHEPFDDRVIPKIKALRAKYPDIIISVDGGVGFETASLLAEAGVNRLVSGSAIFSAGDTYEAIRELKNAAFNI